MERLHIKASHPLSGSYGHGKNRSGGMADSSQQKLKHPWSGKVHQHWQGHLKVTFECSPVQRAMLLSDLGQNPNWSRVSNPKPASGMQALVFSSYLYTWKAVAHHSRRVHTSSEHKVLCTGTSAALCLMRSLVRSCQAVISCNVLPLT